MATITELRRAAAGMPYRDEAKKAEIIAWLREYRPEALEELSDEEDS